MISLLRLLSDKISRHSAAYVFAKRILDPCRYRQVSVEKAFAHIKRIQAYRIRLLKEIRLAAVYAVLAADTPMKGKQKVGMRGYVVDPVILSGIEMAADKPAAPEVAVGGE